MLAHASGSTIRYLGLEGSLLLSGASDQTAAVHAVRIGDYADLNQREINQRPSSTAASPQRRLPQKRVRPSSGENGDSEAGGASAPVVGCIGGEPQLGGAGVVDDGGTGVAAMGEHDAAVSGSLAEELDTARGGSSSSSLSGACLLRVASHASAVACVTLSGSWLLTGGEDALVTVHAASNGAVLHRLQAHTSAVCSVRSVGSCALTAARDGELCAWSVPTGQLLHRLNLFHIRPSLLVPTAQASGGDEPATLLDMRVQSAEDEVCILALSSSGEATRPLVGPPTFGQHATQKLLSHTEPLWATLAARTIPVPCRDGPAVIGLWTPAPE